MDEQQAIPRLKNGDISGLEHLVMSYQPKAVRAAFLITRDSGLAWTTTSNNSISQYAKPLGLEFGCTRYRA
jgi:hypothetical protein